MLLKTIQLYASKAEDMRLALFKIFKERHGYNLEINLDKMRLSTDQRCDRMIVNLSGFTLNVATPIITSKGIRWKGGVVQDVELSFDDYISVMKQAGLAFPEKIPNNQCTISELAVRLLDMEPNIEVNFSENEDGSEYWGAQKLLLFEQEVIIFGYYGGAALQMYEVEHKVLSDMVMCLRYHLAKQENDIIYLFEKV